MHRTTHKESEHEENFNEATHKMDKGNLSKCQPGDL